MDLRKLYVSIMLKQILTFYTNTNRIALMVS